MIAQLIGRGIGFAPGSVTYIVTLGLAVGATPPAAGGHLLGLMGVGK